MTGWDPQQTAQDRTDLRYIPYLHRTHILSNSRLPPLKCFHLTADLLQLFVYRTIPLSTCIQKQAGRQAAKRRGMPNVKWSRSPRTILGSSSPRYRACSATGEELHKVLFCLKTKKMLGTRNRLCSTVPPSSSHPPLPLRCVCWQLPAYVLQATLFLWWVVGLQTSRLVLS
jgi:hypothetical protein